MKKNSLIHRIFSILLVLCSVTALMPFMISSADAKAASSFIYKEKEYFYSFDGVSDILSEKMKNYISTNTTLQKTLVSDNLPVIFMFEGASSHAKTNAKEKDDRIGCKLVVVKCRDNKVSIIYTNDNWTTIPDNPDFYGKYSTYTAYTEKEKGGRGEGVATVLPGVYKLQYIKYHSKQALSVDSGTPTCARYSYTQDANGNLKIGVITSGGSGIWIHRAYFKPYYNNQFQSLGCITSWDMEDFLKKVYNLELDTGIKTSGDAGYLVLDRTLAYDMLMSIYGDTSDTKDAKPSQETVEKMVLTIVYGNEYALSNFTANFDIDGDGKIDETKTWKYGEKLVLPETINGIKVTKWTVMRDDGRSYVSGSGWFTESEIKKNKMTIKEYGAGNGYELNKSFLKDYSGSGDNITFTFTAVGTKTEVYTVTYTGWNYDSSNSSNNFANATVEKGKKLTITDKIPTRSGYTFVGWKCGGTIYEPGKQYSITGNLTLTAQWSVNSYTINWKSDYGTVSGGSSAVQYGSNISIATVTNLPGGYTLKGWTVQRSDGKCCVTGGYGWRNENDIPSGQSKKVYTSANTYKLDESWLSSPGTKYTYTFTAVWEKKQTYTLTYDANGGTGAPKAVEKPQGSVALDPTQPVRTGYTFLGWATTKNATEAVYKAGKANSINITKNVTLYAVWSPNTYKFSFVTNGGTAVSTITCTFGKNLTMPTTTRKGYTFNYWTVTRDKDAKSYTKSNGWQSAANIKKQSDLYQYKPSVNYAINSNWVLQDDTVRSYTVTAVWTANTYSVVFNSNGGTGTMANEAATYDVKVQLTANSFKRDGYTFDSWNTKSDGSGTKYTDRQSVLNLSATNNGRVTLYAQWKPSSYTIVFNANKGTGTMAAQNATYGTEAKLNANKFTREGYTFDSWNTKADGTGTKYTDKQDVKNLTAKADDKFNLYAQWTANSYSIVFNANGGTGTMAALSAKYDAKVQLTANTFTRAGYTFSGWNEKADGSGKMYSDKASVTNLISAANGKITLYAQWEPTDYNVVFDANGGSGTMKNLSVNYGNSVALTANAFTRSGYMFSGWNTKADGTGTKYADKANVKNLTEEDNGKVTLYAQWTANSYTIAFDANGGNGTMNAQNAKYDTAITLTAGSFTREGYTFNGWNTKADGSGTGYADKASVKNLTAEAEGKAVLYAQWVKDSYTVLFDANGGTGSMDSLKPFCDTEFSVPASGFKRSHYSFAGWNTKADGTGTAYAASEKVKDLCGAQKSITLYAQWTPNTISITFNSSGGTAVSTVTAVYGVTSVTIPSDVPTRSGYEFNGWSATGTNGTTVTVNAGSTLNPMEYLTENSDSVTLTAIWDRAIIASGNCGTIRSGAFTSDAVWTLYGDGELVIEPNGGDVEFNGLEWLCEEPTAYTINEIVKQVPWSGYVDQIKTLTVKDGIKSLMEYGLYGAAKLTKVTLPSSMTRIGGYAFYGCSRLTTIVLPANVTTILQDTFYGCSSLSSVQLPQYLVSINGEAFYGCTALTSLTVPASVTGIYSCAFAESGMKDIVFLGSAPTTFTTERNCQNMFYGCTLNIYYPCGDASWSDDQIAAFCFGGGSTLNWVPTHSYENGICTYCGAVDPVAIPSNGVDTGIQLFG